MSTNQSYFQLQELDACNVDQPPEPGFYPGCIERARFRQSANHNRMLQVIFTLDGVETAFRTVCDYFVLAGEHVSASGVFFARRRLVELYRACGIFPAEGDEIIPVQLQHALLQLRIAHDQREGRLTLRIVGYRPMSPPESEQKIPF